MITVVAEIVAKPGREEDLKRELLDMLEKTRAEEGCAQYDLHVALNEPGRFVFYENWASQEAHQAHDETAHVKAFGSKAAELVSDLRVLRYSRIA